MQEEFDRQVDNLLNKDYPKAAGISTDDFLKHIIPLKQKIAGLPVLEVDFEKGRLPFVIVVKSNLLPTEEAMRLTEKDNRQGITKLYPREPKDFKTIEDVTIPEGMVYLIFDIDRGKENINLPPKQAMKGIKKENRSPLTIDEGVAIITHYPDFLIKNNCFSLLSSRCRSDLRVPAIWINSNKNPNLGWCWEGNPHTWLGSASCTARLGV